ncbi:MAG TPA: hypothetical protein VK775_00545, partial [Chthoniobacterales bacterium]|nr:hypothetical protein [Chthoniobacterales bacterium]
RLFDLYLPFFLSLGIVAPRSLRAFKNPQPRTPTTTLFFLLATCGFFHAPKIHSKEAINYLLRPEGCQ